MVILLLLPAILSFFVLGAHYLREGNYLFVLFCLLTPLLLAIRRRAMLRAVQALLVLTCVVWVLTAQDIMQVRMAQGQPFLRAGVIFAGVGAFALLGALLLQTRAVRKCYPSTTVPEESPDSPAGPKPPADLTQDDVSR